LLWINGKKHDQVFLSNHFQRFKGLRYFIWLGKVLIVSRENSLVVYSFVVLQSFKLLFVRVDITQEQTVFFLQNESKLPLYSFRS